MRYTQKTRFGCGFPIPQQRVQSDSGTQRFALRSVDLRAVAWRRIVRVRWRGRPTVCPTRPTGPKRWMPPQAGDAGDAGEGCDGCDAPVGGRGRGGSGFSLGVRHRHGHQVISNPNLGEFVFKKPRFQLPGISVGFQEMSCSVARECGAPGVPLVNVLKTAPRKFRDGVHDFCFSREDGGFRNKEF